MKNKGNSLFQLSQFALFLILPFLIFYWMVPFLATKSLGNDYIKVPHSEQLELRFSLKNGTFPLFVPGYAGGTTAYAMSQGQIFHPHSHLAALMPGYWDGKAVEWNTFFRFLYLGLVHGLLFCLVRHFGLSTLSSFVVSFITVYSLRMLDVFRYAVGLESYAAYLALCAFGTWQYFRPSKQNGPIGIVAATYLLIVGGLPQLSYFGILGSTFVFLFLPFYGRSIRFPNSVRIQPSVWQFYKTVFGSMTLGMALASAFVVPYFFDFILSNSSRVNSGFEFATAYQSENARDFFNCIFNPWKANVHYSFAGSSLFVLALLIPLMAVSKVNVPGAIYFLWGTIISILILGLGSHTPLYYWFWKYFPLATSFRVPGRVTFIVPFLFFLLFIWLFQQRQGLRFISLLAILLLLFFGFASRSAIDLPESFSPLRLNSPSAIVMQLEWAMGLVSVGSLFLFLYWPKKAKILLTILVVSTIAQVVLILEKGTWVVGKSPAMTYQELARNKEKNLLYGKARRILIDSSMSHELFFERARRGYYEDRLARICSKIKPVSSLQEAYQHIESQQDRDYIAIEGFQRVKGKTLDPFQSNALSPQVTLERNTFNQFIFKAITSESSFFVLSFPYSPQNWKAFLNGKPVEIYRANAMDQAIWLSDSGEYRIEFQYISLAAVLGMVISLVTLLLCIWIGLNHMKNAKYRFLLRGIAAFGLCFAFWFWYQSLHGGQNINSEYSWHP